MSSPSAVPNIIFFGVRLLCKKTMADYSFMATGLSGSTPGNTDITLEDLSGIQAVVLVFLDDAMCFGHCLQCCWEGTGGAARDREEMSRKHAMMALHVMAVGGIQVNSSNWGKIQRYIARLKEHGGPLQVAANIGAVVDKIGPEMEARMRTIETNVTLMPPDVRRQTLVQAEAKAAEYASWVPKNAVESAVRTSIEVLSEIMEQDAHRLPGS